MADSRTIYGVELSDSDVFSRTELRRIYDRASRICKVQNLPAEWLLVFSDMAHAAHTLDAFIARAELKP